MEMSNHSMNKPLKLEGTVTPALLFRFNYFFHIVLLYVFISFCGGSEKERNTFKSQSDAFNK